MNVFSLPDGIGTEHSILGDGTQEIGAEQKVEITIRNIRREHTGVHGLVAILLRDTILGYDTFNIGRSEERLRLAKAAHKMLQGLAAQVYDLETLRHDLDLLCLYACRQYEQERYQIEEIDPNERTPAPVYLIQHFILQGGGTIIFAPPGSAKSYILQIMAVCIAQGTCGPFTSIQQQPVLYVNLERSREEFLRREAAIRKCLGVTYRSGVRYLHARGHSLRAVAPAIEKWHRENSPGLVLYDSISRAGLGKLIDDDTANAFTDTVNACSESWAALGHTPRGDQSHQFGSVHYEAGEDIGVRLSSEHREAEMGIMLQVVKSNASGLPPPWYGRLLFDGPQGPLIKIETARSHDYPLLLGGTPTVGENLLSYLADVGKASPTEIAKAIGIPRTTVSSVLHSDKRFVQTGKEGRETQWGRRTLDSAG